MNKLYAITDMLTRWFCRVSSCFFVVIVILVVTNVVARKLFNVSISGIIEIVTYGMLFVTGICMARTVFAGGHVTVDLFTSRMSPGVKRVFAFITLLISSIILFAVFYFCLVSIPDIYAKGQVSDNYKIPYYIVYILMCFGLVTSALAFVFSAFFRLLPPNIKEVESDAEAAL